VKKFFNRYKLKRKLGRQIQSASKFVFSYNQINNIKIMIGENQNQILSKKQLK